MKERIIVIATICGLILACFVLLFGDNIYQQITGRPFFQSIVSYTPRDNPTRISSTTDSPNFTETPNPWAGVIDISQDGLRLINGYDLWFTSLAGNRWQVWKLDGSTGFLQKIVFLMTPQTQLLDEFVPALSPDGKKLAFAVGTCEEGGLCNRDIFIANIDGSEVSQITNTCADQYHPSWSPDGTLLAFFAGSWQGPNCPDQPHGIWIYDFRSGSIRQLTDQVDYNPVWSPDGKFIAYNSANPTKDIKILEYASCGVAINSCQTWVAADIGSITDSPGWINNSTIFFSSDADGDWDLYQVPIIPNQTLSPSKLTENNYDDHYPAISTDGRILVWQAFPYYQEGGDVGPATGKAAVIHVMSIDDQIEIPLITGIGNSRDAYLALQK